MNYWPTLFLEVEAATLDVLRQAEELAIEITRPDCRTTCTRTAYPGGANVVVESHRWGDYFHETYLTKSSENSFRILIQVKHGSSDYWINLLVGLTERLRGLGASCSAKAAVKK